MLAGRRRRSAERERRPPRARSRRAVAAAAAGDVVVIAGKGHEQGQEFEGGRKVPFDDVTVAREALRGARRAARVIDRDAELRSPQAAGGRAACGRAARRRARAARSIDSREVEPGDLFVGLRASAPTAALRRRRARRGGLGRRCRARPGAPSWRRWRRPHRRACSPPTTRSPRCSALAAPGGASWARRSSGVTGSTGKTSTKDILAALLRAAADGRTPPQNCNTEIGLPLTILAAARGTEALVLEMAMRGEGQIAELAAIAEPDVGVIVNVGPVHLELLGDGRARRRGEGRADPRPAPRRRPRSCPASEPLLDAHLRHDIDT